MYRLLFILLLGYSPLSLCTEQAFLDGIKSYKESQFELAQEKFKEALSKDPNNTQVLINLGLAEQKLTNNGAAIAAWRKVLAIDPSHKAAKEALSFMHKDFPLKKSQSLWEALRSHILSFLALNFILGLFCLLLIFGGWQWVSYFHKKKKYEPTDSEYPGFPVKASLILSLICLSFLLSLFKLYDFFEPRGTIIKKEVQVRVSPNDKGLELIILAEADELILRKNHDDWVQIKTLNGITGWIKKDDFFQTQGRQL